MTTIRTVAAIFLSLSATGASAAEINAIKPEKPGNATLIIVEGELQLGDDKKFVDAALRVENALVALAGPGGNLSAGISIGEAIRLKGFSTVVIGGHPCASACALAWLGGRKRIMGAGAKIGFHAASLPTSAGPAVTSVGNAVVGAYLNKLGLPVNAIVYITSPAPEEIQWLEPGDARRYGIDVITDDQVKSPQHNAGQVATVPTPQPLTISPAPLKPSNDLARLEDAIRVQQRLITLGYLIGDADGVWGVRSRNALRQFRRLAGLGLDDAWTLETEQRLFSPYAAYSPISPESFQYQSGTFARFEGLSGGRLNPLNVDDALTIQTRLTALGFYRTKANGNWGAGSRHALREFKLVNGLSFDDTWDGVAEQALFGGSARSNSNTVFGRWTRSGGVCAPDQVLSIYGSRLEAPSYGCDIGGWRANSLEWTGAGVCKLIDGRSTNATFRFRVASGGLVDLTSKLTYARCP